MVIPSSQTLAVHFSLIVALVVVAVGVEASIAIVKVEAFDLLGVA